MATHIITTIRTLLGEIVVYDRRYELDEKLRNTLNTLRKREEENLKRITELEAQLDSLSISYEEAVKYAEEQKKRANALYSANTECAYKLQSALNRERQSVSDILDSLQSVITKFKG